MELQNFVQAFEAFLVAYSNQQTLIVREEIRNYLQDMRKDQIEKERAMTAQEVADELKITLQTVRKWYKAGKLKCHYKGNRVYFLRSELYASLKNQRVSK